MPAPRTAHSPVILTYHSIAEGDSPLKISPALFTEQMEWLAANASVCTLAQLLAGRDSLGPRPVILTFDDGYLDFYTYAAPVLRRLTLPAIIFLPTGYVGRTNGWPGQPSWVKEEPLMNWEQVKELADAGIEFGSHTVSHPDLCALKPAEIERELAESSREIEKRTSRKVEHFCYPYGKWSIAVQRIVGANYRSACTTIAGTVAADSPPTLLPRVDAHYVRNPRWFRAMFTRQFEAYVAARRLIRRVRRQPEGGYPGG